MGTPEVEALKSTLESNSRWAGWCTIAVFAGLIVEYTILLWLKKKELSWTEIILTFIAGVAIAGGVYGEYLFGSRASGAALQLESISERRASELNNTTESAKVTIRELELSIVLGEERIKQAELARAKIEESLAWRRLTQQQQTQIGTRLRRFYGQAAGESFNQGDAEAETFAWDIASALRAGHWDVFAPATVILARRSGVRLGPRAVVETGVVVSSTVDEKSRNASDALVRELVARGFDASKSSAVLSEQNPWVLISVNVRPLGPQGEAKLRGQK